MIVTVEFEEFPMLSVEGHQGAWLDGECIVEYDDEGVWEIGGVKIALHADGKWEHFAATPDLATRITDHLKARPAWCEHVGELVDGALAFEDTHEREMAS